MTDTHQPLIDSFKLMHWMNARKVTPSMVAEKSGLSVNLIEETLGHKKVNWDFDKIINVAATLNVPQSYLMKEEGAEYEEVIFWDRARVLSTKREIFRDGIHFYNYYTWPSPKGYISPVVLDILCPEGRLPAMNNGHLEGAITINLGPGDIYGRWDQELNPTSYQVLAANKEKEHTWILGDSYVEPCYCPHTYSLVGSAPAQILSYTMKSELEDIFMHLNTWPEETYANFTRAFEKKSTSAFLQEQMDRHGFTVKALSQTSKVPDSSLSAFLEGNEKSLSVDQLKTVAEVLGFDYRLLLTNEAKKDSLGKIHCSYKESVNSIRDFHGYKIATMSSSVEFPDLSGVYMKVEGKHADLDLNVPGNSHYYVSQGKLTFKTEKKTLELSQGDTLWVAPYVKHSFSGEGGLVRMTNGENLNYLDRYALSQTYNLPRTLKRARKDNVGWGYDKK